MEKKGANEMEVAKETHEKKKERKKAMKTQQIKWKC